MAEHYWMCKICGMEFYSYNKSVAVADKRVHINTYHPGAKWDDV